MLVRNFVALLVSGVLVTSALKLSTLYDIYDSAVEYTFDSIDARQIPLGTSRVLSQDDVHQVHGDDVENDIMQFAPQKAENRTIYQVLSDNPKFSRLVKIINISDDIISLLNDSSADITFFAVPNHALQPPKRRKRHPSNLTAFSLDNSTVFEAYSSYKLPEIVAEIEELESYIRDDPDKEPRKKFIRILVKAILSYHVIPKRMDVVSLTHNTTYPTSLVIPDNALDQQALRVRVLPKLIPPSVHINFYSKVIKPNIGTENGIIHVLNQPLLPPPSIFQELFLAPRIFGAVASGLQRIGLTNAVEWRYVHKDDAWSKEGTGSTTFFVPSNLAFKKLPWKLELFLFSPFGEKVLKKLLQFHVVPGIVLHSDYLYNATSGESDAWPDVYDELDLNYSENSFLELEAFAERHSVFPPMPYISRGYDRGYLLPRPSGDFPHHPHAPPAPPASQGTQGLYDRHEFSANVTLPTLLMNHSLHVHITKKKYSIPIPGHKKDIYVTKLFVNHQSVAVSDVISRNGAVHIIDKVLNPRPFHHRPHKPEIDEDADDWEDWEDWLPQWAEEC